MSDQTQYLDKHGLKAIFPASSSTVYRLRCRAVDPFPEGQIIGGKRYFRLDLVLSWCARQGAEPDRVQEVDHLDVAVLDPVQDAGQGAI